MVSWEGIPLKQSNRRDELRLLAFYDLAYAYNNKKVYNVDQAELMMGAGSGVRYIIGNNLTFRGDLISDNWYYFTLLGQKKRLGEFFCFSKPRRRRGFATASFDGYFCLLHNGRHFGGIAKW